MKHLLNLRMALAALVVLMVPALVLAAPVTVNWWHAHGGALGEKVNEICDGFNKSQNQYQVVPTYKGNYSDTMNAGIAAFRAKSPPHILQVFEVGTATMMAAKGAVYPVFQLMADAKEAFDPKAYIGPVYGYYSTTDGKLLSMPFNSSSPVLYWNKAAFKKAGLDPEKPPKTWPEMGQMSQKLLASEAEFFQKKPMPMQLKLDIQNNQAEMKAHGDLLDAKRKETASINAKYDEDKRRYLELSKAGTVATAAPASTSAKK